MESTLANSLKSIRPRREKTDNEPSPRKRPRLHGDSIRQAIGMTAGVARPQQVAQRVAVAQHVMPPATSKNLHRSGPLVSVDDAKVQHHVKPPPERSKLASWATTTGTPTAPAESAAALATTQGKPEQQQQEQLSLPIQSLSKSVDECHLIDGPPPIYRPMTSTRIAKAVVVLLLSSIFCLCSVQAWHQFASSSVSFSGSKYGVAEFPHILVPCSSQPGGSPSLTLRQVLSDTNVGYHLAMAPAFFGFYGYFGALAAWETATTTTTTNNVTTTMPPQHTPIVRSVAGASAGALAAILLAAGISPAQAASFCNTIQLHQFADFPGVGAVFRGDKFEQTMFDFLKQSQIGSGRASSSLLEESQIPVAVSAFDLQTMQGQILTKGSMARAARASATFPFLFQPVGWMDDEMEDFVFIDGGIADRHGMAGLEAFMDRVPAGSRQRVINLKVGGFYGRPPGPSKLSVHGRNGTIVEVISVSLQNLPQPGPWALSKGPIAVEAARQAMMASLDCPLFAGSEDHHYELHIDTAMFWQS